MTQNITHLFQRKGFLLYNRSMNNIGEYIALIGFIGGLVAFFVKTGEYKNNLNAKIEAQEKEIETINKEIKEIKISVEKNENNMSKLETMLIEIKTKLELVLQYSGMFNGREKNKK